MLLNIFKVNTNLPYEEIKEELNCERVWDIDVSKYEFNRTQEINYKRIDDLIGAIEKNEVDLKLEISDIIEILPSSNELNDIRLLNDLNIENGLNFLIKTSLGMKQIALEAKYFCR